VNEIEKEKTMKALLCVAAGLLVIGVAVSLAPDIYRYMKISAM
jgi:hypothetical protein